MDQQPARLGTNRGSRPPKPEPAPQRDLRLRGGPKPDGPEDGSEDTDDLRCTRGRRKIVMEARIFRCCYCILNAPNLVLMGLVPVGRIEGGSIAKIEEGYARSTLLCKIESVR